MKNFSEQYYMDDGFIAVVFAEHVTRALIDYILKNETVQSMQFTDAVKSFEDECFKGLNVDCVDFATAENLENIGYSCFENAKNIHAEDCFENVQFLKPYAFAGAESDDCINLPNVKYVPEGCFESAKINHLVLTNSVSMKYNAFRNAVIANLSVDSKFRKLYKLNHMAFDDNV